MPIAWAELPAPVQQLVYEGLGVMGVLALNREWRAQQDSRHHALATLLVIVMAHTVAMPSPPTAPPPDALPSEH